MEEKKQFTHRTLRVSLFHYWRWISIGDVLHTSASYNVQYQSVEYFLLSHTLCVRSPRARAHTFPPKSSMRRCLSPTPSPRFRLSSSISFVQLVCRDRDIDCVRGTSEWSGVWCLRFLHATMHRYRVVVVVVSCCRLSRFVIVEWPSAVVTLYTHKSQLFGQPAIGCGWRFRLRTVDLTVDFWKLNENTEFKLDTDSLSLVRIKSQQILRKFCRHDTKRSGDSDWGARIVAWCTPNWTAFSVYFWSVTSRGSFFSTVIQ